MAEREHPTVDGAAINPYDLPGEPRPAKDEPTPAPTADESAPVPGPGDPDTPLVEVGGEGVGALGLATGGASDPFAAVTAEQAASLRAAGFDTADKIRSAGDDELDAVDGIGPAAVAKLREATRA
jgi:hypothetical protein